MNKKEVLGLIFRYVILVVLAVPNLYLFYAIFTPLTIYPIFWVLNMLYGAELLQGNIIFFKGVYAEIIPACVAGAAYYLLVALNLTTPMSLEKRAKSLVFIMAGFLVLNIIRILIFAVLLFVGYQYFDIAHTTVWYFGSTILVILLWFGNVWLFKIRKIPVYNDLMGIFSDIRK